MLVPKQNNQVPPNVGSSEPDAMPISGSGGVMKPTAPAPTTGDAATQEPDGMQGQDGAKDEIQKNLEQHLNNIPDDQKRLLAEYLTPETVRVIGIINGPEVADYLSKFMDPEKVLVPVPRKLAEEHYAQQQSAQNGQAQPAMPQQTPAPAGNQGIMSPPQQATATLPQR